MVLYTFLFISLFSAVKALIKISSGTKVLSRRKGLPGVGKTLLTSTLTAATKTILKASAAAAFMRDTSKMSRKKEANLATIAATVLFNLTLFLSPVFLTVPTFTATPTLVVMKLCVLAGVAGVSFSSLSRTVPYCMYVVTVPFFCDVSRKVSVKVVACIILGLLAKGTGRGGLDLLVCMLTVLFVLGCTFLWLIEGAWGEMWEGSVWWWRLSEDMFGASIRLFTIRGYLDGSFERTTRVCHEELSGVRLRVCYQRSLYFLRRRILRC